MDEWFYMLTLECDCDSLQNRPPFFSGWFAFITEEPQTKINVCIRETTRMYGAVVVVIVVAVWRIGLVELAWSR